MPVTTLAGREEKLGLVYPGWIEKVSFLLVASVAIWLGIWIWQDSGWPMVGQLTSIICGLPLLTLFITEAVGRIAQSLHGR